MTMTRPGLILNLALLLLCALALYINLLLTSDAFFNRLMELINFGLSL